MQTHSIHAVPFISLSLSGLGDRDASLSRGGQAIHRALRLMEVREDLHFLLKDLVFLEHYLTAHPEDADAVRRLIAAGRLEVGASWVGLGQNFQMGEDLVRNLVYGKMFAERRLEAFPDTVCLGEACGLTPQFPQVARGCGVGAVVVRGCDGLLLRWRAPDGSEVRAWNDAAGPGLLWNASHGEAAERVAATRSVLAACEEEEGPLPLLWGGWMVQPSVEAVEDLLEWAQAEEVALAVGGCGRFLQERDASDFSGTVDGVAPPLPSLEPLFPGVAPLNVPAIHGLLRAEQAAAAGVVCGLPYPHEELRGAWLRVLEAMEPRFDGPGAADTLEWKARYHRLALWTAEEVARKAERAVAERVQVGQGPEGTLAIVVFNSLSRARTDVVEARVMFYGAEDPRDFSRYEMYRIVDAAGEVAPFQEVEGRQTETAELQLAFVARDVPPNGYAAYYLVPHVPEASQLMNIQAPGMMAPEFPEPEFAVQDVDDRVSEPYRGVRVGRRFQTAALEVEVDEVTGRVTARSRSLDRVLAEGIHLVGREESMQAGLEEYAYTGRRFEVAVDRVDLEESGEVRATLRVEGRLLSSPFQIRYRFYGALDRMDVEVDLDWKDDKPVRVQMVFPVGEGKIHYGVPFGYEVFEDGAGEKQRACQGWVAVDGETGGCVLAGNRRTFEFEEGEVRSDVLRSCLDPASYSYKRIWRSYPEVMTCRYSLRGYAGDFREGLAWCDGWALNRPLNAQVVYGTEASKPLPDRMSFVRLEGEGLVVSAVKAAEDGRGYVLRAYETLGRPCSARLEAFGGLQSVQEADLLERARGDADPDAIEFAPFEIKTIRFEPGEVR